MSLHIYRTKEEVPTSIKCVAVNDEFFNIYTELLDSKLASDILKVIDKAVYNSNLTFIGRTKELGALNKSNLSTGAKTLLNIIQHPNKCFDVAECGNNALEFLPQIHKGYIIWELPALVYTGSHKCDIVYRNIRYTNFYEFLAKVEREERG